ncbi:MAG: diacylglycerol kinase family lipid kinase [Anaerolineales bacterium]|nr:MAG: diacylglycerol kinase family lipid kinase [Anaerolineales bacterium]
MQARSRVSKIKLIVNPVSGRGYGRKACPLIRQYLSDLGADFDLVQTGAPGEAIHLARQALNDGFDTIVAVGGDGTSHEVVNGMMSGAKGPIVGTLGCIPTGCGNDFAVSNGVPTDLEEACRLIVAGETRLVDIGRVTLDGRITRHFDNTIGIGFDGLASMEARKFKRLRGMALYLPVVLKTIFLTMHPPRVEIEFDGQVIRQRILMAVIANGPREGSSFLVAPGARYDDGLLDLIIAGTMSKLQMLAMVPKFMKGTHIHDRRVATKRARHVIVSSEDPLYIHVDGEVLCEEAHRVEATLIPSCLRIIAPAETA